MLHLTISNKSFNFEFQSIKLICLHLLYDLIIFTNLKESLLFHSDHIVEFHQYNLKDMMKCVIYSQNFSDFNQNIKVRVIFIHVLKTIN